MSARGAASQDERVLPVHVLARASRDVRVEDRVPGDDGRGQPRPQTATPTHGALHRVTPAARTA